MASDGHRASVLDVADYILTQHAPISAKKLQKLVYYAQAWSLVWDGRPLFGEPVEAWEQGPVVRTLFRAHQGQFRVQDRLGGDESHLGASTCEAIDAVLDQYAQHSGDELGELTHAEAPWRDTPRNGVISHALMREYYGGLDLEAISAMGTTSGLFCAKYLASKIADANRHALVDWGAPVGREAW